MPKTILEILDFFRYFLDPSADNRVIMGGVRDLWKERIMKKLFNLSLLVAFLFGSTLTLATATDVYAQKRCEKCERGPDGKMVCKPVPCPK